jgi:aminoglycoside phosphotransferase (APT) family kinase protein
VLAWLARAGGPAPSAFDLTLLGYRPLRRAVLRATADEAVSYVKVLRPDRADRLATRQELLAAAGLTPAVVARPAPGVLVTPAATGRPLAGLLADPGSAEVPTAAALVELLDRLPAGLAGLDRRPAWADRLDFHAATATQRLPAAADRIEALAATVQRQLDTAPVGPLVPTHGDFYEANILVEGSRLNLIDLDAAGPGRREDDLACLLAHVAVLPPLSPFHYGHVPELLEAWTGDFSARVDPAALFARVAAVVLSLVAGGENDQAEIRLALAEAWAARALAG